MRFIRLICIISVLVLITGYVGFFDEVVIGGQVGDYFVCTFDEYGVGTKYINESVSGQVWLSVIPDDGINYNNGVQGSGDKYYNWFSTSASGAVTHLNLTFYSPITFVNFSATQSSTYDYYLYSYYDFMNSMDEKMFRVTFQDRSAGDADVDMLIYDEDNVKLYEKNSITQNRPVNVTVNTTTQMFGITHMSGCDIWFDAPDTYDYISNIWIHDLCSSGAKSSSVDDIWVSYQGSTPELWDYNSMSFGSVTAGYFSETVFSFLSEYSLVTETENSQFYGSAIIHQVGACVGDTTEIDAVEFRLRIGDVVIGQYDRAYAYGGDRYILIWDIAQTFTDATLNMEWFITGDETDTVCSQLFVNTDIDGDGDKHRYYSYENAYYNGLYDGVISESTDWTYQVWYTPSDSSGQYGNVSRWKSKFDIDGSWGYISFGDNNYFEFDYSVDVSDIIYALDIMFNADWVDRLLDIEHTVQAYINCDYIGSADYYVPYDSQRTLARWILDNPIYLDSEDITIEVRCGLTPVQVCYSDGDFDRDGDIRFYYHDFANTFGDCVDTGWGVNRDIIWRYWYSPPDIEMSDLVDKIIVDKSTYKQYDIVKVGVTVNDSSLINTVRAFFDTGGVGWKEYSYVSYPLSPLPAEIIGANTFNIEFLAQYSGNWNVTLWRGGSVVASCWFNVTPYPVDYLVFTNPNPSFYGDTVDIYYMYNFSDSYAIRLMVEDDDGVFHEFPISVKQVLTYAGSFKWYTEGIFQIKLQRRENVNLSFGTIFPYDHTNKLQVYENTLRLEYYARTGKLGDMQLVQTIYFQHNFLGYSNVAVLVNLGNMAKYMVGYASSGTCSFRPSASGNYSVSLVLIEYDGSFTYLCSNVNFEVTIIDEDDVNTGDVEFWDIVFFILGFVLFSIFIILGAWIANKFKNNRTVGGVIVGSFGLIGVFFSCILGWFPVWTGLVIGLFMIIVLVGVIKKAL